MRSVQLSTEGTGNKGSSELNFHPSRDGHKEVRNGVVGEGHGFSEEDESRVNGVAEDVNNSRGVIVQVIQADLQQQHPQQQQPLGPIVRWERFLPLRSLKVLLVENDDSTRQVVSLLLRNCSYEVTTAANGLQAWKILGDLTNHIDLILTEVVMPCLSGIGLLSKIMSHKTCKNIPVIMMSSHDSMGIVFKCLSKGAVDFLVKPIRKNELKNLWQHVWRRCHSSSGSGSESGIQTQKSAKSKSDDESDNNTGSNDEDDNASIGMNVRDGSDNGSGTQSSWTKRAIEVDSPQPMSPWDQLGEPHDSTCAQVIHPKPETFCNEWVPMIAIRNCQESKEQLLDNVEMGKDLEIGVPRNPDLELESYPKEKVSTKISGAKDKLPQQDPKKDMQSNDNLLELNSNSPSSKLRVQAADLIGASNQISENRVAEAPNYLSKTSEIKDKATSYPQLPSLDLSLKRLRSVGDDRIATQNDRNVLRRSDLSAFSRYTTANAASQATGCGGSSSLPLDNSSDAVKIESVYNLQSNPNVALNQSSNGSSNNNDMGSTTKNAFTKPAALKDKSISVPTAKSVQPSSAFQPVQQCHSYPPQKVMPEKVDVVAAAAVGQPTGAQRQVQVQHHHHHYHHHHHHVHSMQQQPSADPDDLSLKNMAVAAPQCGSSNVFGEPMEGNAGNYSLNGSISGSNHGSNGQNGSNTAVNAGGLNIESDNGLVGKSVAAGVSGSGSGSGVDQNRFAQREAALTKFRQKRKERCFEKKDCKTVKNKYGQQSTCSNEGGTAVIVDGPTCTGCCIEMKMPVRYQSRKRLAEQRPRVRGQFVRQIVYEHTSRDVDS